MRGLLHFALGLSFFTTIGCSSGSDGPKSFAEAYDVSEYDFVVTSTSDIGLGTGSRLWKMVWNEVRTANGNNINYNLSGFLIGPWGEIPLTGNYFFPSINTRRVTHSKVPATEEAIGPNSVRKINISLPYRFSDAPVKAWVSLVDSNGVESAMDYQIEASYEKAPD